VTMEVEKMIREMKERMPWIRYRVVDPEDVPAILAKLGYDEWYDRGKYDVITFHEGGKERALLVWNLAKGPDRRNPRRPWVETTGEGSAVTPIPTP